MVGKLIKYDFKSFFRLLFPVQLIIIGIAVMNRVVQLFENSGNATYGIAFTSSIILLCIACVVGLVMCFIISVVRFYQGLYSNEGYLSHMLPVSAAEHIWAKLIVSMLFMVGTVFAIFLAVNVATLGDVQIELYKAGAYLFRVSVQVLKGHTFLYLLEAIVLLLVLLAASFMKVYFCISIGQLAQRKKVLLAFGVYFGIYVLSQILGTIFIVLSITVFRHEPWARMIERTVDYIQCHPIASGHIFSLILIVCSGVIGLVYYLVSKRIMSKHLNLN